MSSSGVFEANGVLGVRKVLLPGTEDKGIAYSVDIPLYALVHGFVDDVQI